MSTAQASTTVDDERVRVTTWTFAVTAPDGSTREMIQEAGSPYLGRAGTEHDVVNVSGAAAVFVEIELKG